MNTPALRVMILDDHDSLRRNLAALLEDEGFVVFEAGSGEVAEVLLEQDPVDVAIVDMRLPGMSGLEFIERAAQQYPALRFIVHTGSVDFVLPPNARQLKLRPQDVFFKPIEDLEAFFGCIRGARQEI